MQPVAGAHASAVQTLPSSQPAPTPLQAPPKHVSPPVHALPSLHVLPSTTVACAQPPAWLQESAVQSLPSLQLVTAPLPHTPDAQVSPVVHLLPSSHAAPLLPAVNVQPSVGSHASTVQGLASLHTTAVPLQDAAMQVSPVVQWLASSQLVPSLTDACVQPITASQPSAVHGLLSLQAGLPVPMQLVPLHVSTAVHGLPSLQAVPALTAV